MIFCDECGIRPAAVHLTTIVNGVRKEINLCGECVAKKKAMALDLSELAGQLGEIMRQNGINPQQEKKSEPLPDITCSVCGTTYAMFHSNGRVGCAQCYSAFRQPLSGWLKEKAGSDRHTGRKSIGLADDVARRIRLRTLRRSQEEAIANEQYEKAAELRDQIRALTDEPEAMDHA